MSVSVIVVVVVEVIVVVVAVEVVVVVVVIVVVLRERAWLGLRNFPPSSSVWQAARPSCRRLTYTSFLPDPLASRVYCFCRVRRPRWSVALTYRRRITVFNPSLPSLFLPLFLSLFLSFSLC